MLDSIKDILVGKVFTFEITHLFLMISLASVSIPALMIFLSVALPAKSKSFDKYCYCYAVCSLHAI